VLYANLMIQNKLGYTFNNPGLLTLALTHKSFSNENRNFSKNNIKVLSSLNNERLEFLGDSVLGLAITEIIYLEDPLLTEGEMSKLRSLLVSETPLASIARKIDLGSFVLLGLGELENKGFEKDSILASAYEAVIGAIYLDSNLFNVIKVLRLHFGPDMFQIKSTDYKSALQEIAQIEYKAQPVYSLLKQTGLNHSPVFEVQVTVNNLWATGFGPNKKKAEQVAAKNLLTNWKILT
jgi:ribonuclease-3